MSGIHKKIQEENGAILAISLIIMGLLSLIGAMAIMTSSLESKISGNEKQYKIAFYAADSGMEQARWLLRNDFMESGSDNGWSDELSGNHGEYAAATGQNIAGSALRIDQSAAGNPIRYTVWIWNNTGFCPVYPPAEPCETPTFDRDNLIWVRSQGFGDPKPGAEQQETMVEIEAMLEGVAAPGPRKYVAQEGAGSAKHSSTDDLGSVDTSRSITM